MAKTLKLPTPDEIRKAISASGSMNEATYSLKGFDVILPYTEAIRLFEKNNKPIPKILGRAPLVSSADEKLFDRLCKAKTIDEFKKILGKKVLKDPEGKSINAVRIESSKINKNNLILHFQHVSESDSKLLPTIGIPLKSISKILRIKQANK